MGLAELRADVVRDGELGDARAGGEDGGAGVGAGDDGDGGGEGVGALFCVFLGLVGGLVSGRGKGLESRGGRVWVQGESESESERRFSVMLGSDQGEVKEDSSGFSFRVPPRRCWLDTCRVAASSRRQGPNSWKPHKQGNEIGTCLGNDQVTEVQRDSFNPDETVVVAELGDIDIVL